MDMQKELINCNNWILEQDDDFVTGYGQGDYALGLARLAWQAAKAQALPEGFVLVPKEPTEAMHQAGQNIVTFGGDYDDIYGAMIEAQEPK